MKSKQKRLCDLIVESILKELYKHDAKIDVDKEDGYIVINYMNSPFDSTSHWQKIRVSITL